MNGASSSVQYEWWASLKHGGLLIAPSKLAERFPSEIDPLPQYLADRLRRSLARAGGDLEGNLPDLLDTVLEEIVGLERESWLKGSLVDPGWSRRALTREIIKPRRIWRTADGGILPLFVDDKVKRLGVGRGRRPVSRVVEWLRKADQKIALLTNGRQWRLIHAGADYDAWSEWDTDLWFEEGRPGDQVTALRILLSPESLIPEEDAEPPRLLAAIQASRKGQAELSSALGERVRQAVELLIRASAPVLERLDQPESVTTHRDIYIAATRIIMRCVVVLFAEARDLLPRDNPIYNGSYGLGGLRTQLDRQAAGRAFERLRHSHSAWPRLLALFRLIHRGSGHEALTIRRYGGELFAAGNADSEDGILRALETLEDPNNAPSDAAVHQILELLTRSRVKVRQGRGATWVMTPVDFSDLSSEYIGILYEGLLDYELRRAGEEPMVFLNVGDQPVLPFSTLDTLNNESLVELLKKLGTVKRVAATESDEGDRDSEDEEEQEEDFEEADEDLPAGEESDEETDDESGEEAPEEGADDQRRIATEWVQTWAERAVKAAEIVAYPKNDSDPLVRERFDQDVQNAAKRLVVRIILPGEWFLVRWGGTRKGAGTFYTRPQLAGPTVRRTLDPLVYQSGKEEIGGQPSTRDRENHVRVPRLPEAILSLKVCDPAMGSGSFLVSALRYLTDGLMESLHHHGRLEARSDGTLCKLADGVPSDDPAQELLPVPPDHPEFEERLRARLKRHVVERCLYGVDIDPLAVELAKMSLWVETMDQRLPFGFLDHKLKCGNALVGCWFDRFQDYPLMAWEREGGDKNHARFVHHCREYEVTRGKKKGQTERKGDPWTAAIKEGRERAKLEMVDSITGQKAFQFLPAGQSPQGVHDRAVEVFERLHSLPIHETERQAEVFSSEILADPDLRRLREAFDTWCAVWFWPGGRIADAPMPSDFLLPSEATRQIVGDLAAQHRFFHWELEFPDVFGRSGSGFDAVVGNPPWEIQKPNSKEFFSNKDPLYRTYGKQVALRLQEELFAASPSVEEEWIGYCAQLKALSNWTKHAGFPFGDPRDGGGKFSLTRSAKNNEDLHRLWRNQRRRGAGYADPEHPFRHQGSADINTYKMFLETCHALLRLAGFLGMLVPSGLYSDQGSTGLRELFLHRCRWLWLFGFENREGIFDIHRSYKFCPVIVEKGGQTGKIRAAFMHRNLLDWEEAEKHVLDYPRDRVERFSPESKAILEIRTERDLEVLTKLYDNGVLLGDQGPDGWGIKYAREFDMTNDSHLFPPRPAWEAEGYRPDEYGHWLKGGWRDWDGSKSILRRPRGLIMSQDGGQVIDVGDIEDVALPLYEGRMIGQFDFSEKGWVSGKGRSAVWREIPFERKGIEPQYLMRLSDHAGSKGAGRIKIGFLGVGSATNARSMVCSLVNGFPCGNSVPTLEPGADVGPTLSLVGLLNSFGYDFTLRARLGGINLNYFVIEETPLLAQPVFETTEKIGHLVARLCCCHRSWAAFWERSGRTIHGSLTRSWALSDLERTRLRCNLEALLCHLIGLEVRDLKWILRDCDLSPELVGANEFVKRVDPKGFWRVHKDRMPELRQSVLSVIALQNLEEMGIDTFLNQNEGEGWMIPETLRLADYGLGQDDRAKDHQPVASRLGPRFFDWQLQQSVEESWEECEAHAELILRIVPVPELVKGKESAKKSAPTDLFGNPLKTDLFGNPIYPKSRKR